MKNSIFLGLIPVLMLAAVPNVYATNGFSGDDFISNKSQRPAINEDFVPDASCGFDAYQIKCVPGSAQSCDAVGFGNNEDYTCFPRGDCPQGYGLMDDDETGQCYPDVCREKPKFCGGPNSCYELGPANCAPGSCYARGVEDGKNNDFGDYFKIDLSKDCDAGEFLPRYYEGFINGCIDAGNTREICESFTDD